MAKPILNEVGRWTEVKLSILRDYAQSYATILNKQKIIKHFAYIDGFAGIGAHISKSTGQLIEGSPLIALNLDPGFTHCHFIDLKGKFTDSLRMLVSGRKDATVYKGDCNKILVRDIFPECRYEDFRRALCVLDPCRLDPNWEVVLAAGKMKSVEIFLTFMIMDANMNILLRNPDKAKPAQLNRMLAFWGDDSWRLDAYTDEPTLFGDEPKKAANEAIAEAYRKRLKDVAGFKYVPKPLPMKNDKGLVVYYLYFASHNATGNKIAKAVFKKYRDMEGYSVH